MMSPHMALAVERQDRLIAEAESFRLGRAALAARQGEARPVEPRRRRFPRLTWDGWIRRRCVEC
jgi:hypothetical protein